MTDFQIISIALGFLGIITSTIGIYVVVKTDIAKMQVQILELRNLIAVNKADNAEIKANNRADHRLMFEKIEELKILLK